MKYSSPRIFVRSSRRYAAYFGLFLSLLLSLGWLLSSHSSTAQAEGNARPEQVTVKFSVKALYGGDFKYGNWLPVEVSLENSGSSTTVNVETTIANDYSGSKLSSVYQRSVKLDERASKKVILYVHPFVPGSSTSHGLSYPLEVRLVAGGKVLDVQTLQLQPVDNADYLLGMIGVSQSAANQLNDMHVGPLQSRVTTTMLALSDLPDRVEGLSSFDALLLSNVSTDSLTNDQQTALKSWIRQGGTLLLMGGIGWSKIKAGLEPSLLPFQVYDYSNVKDLSGLAQMLGDKAAENLNQPTIVARGEILQGASSLAVSINPNNPTDITPLVAQRLLGSGRVIATAADLTLPPVSDWSETPRLWQRLLNYSAPVLRVSNTDYNSQYRTNNDYFNLIANVSSIGLPNILPFFLILIIYIVLAGPLNYLVLRRMHRTGLAWLTIPLTIAVFTVTMVIFFVNRQPAGQALVNQISVIKTDNGSDTAQLQSYVAVFSPEDKNFDIKVNLPSSSSFALFHPLIHQTNLYSPHQDNQVIAEDGQQAGLTEFHVAQWGVQGFSVESNLLNQNYNLQTDLHFQNYAIVGTVRNLMPQSIHDALLVYGEQIVHIRDLAPGESTSVNLPLAAPIQATLAYCAPSYSSYSSYAANIVTDKISAAWPQASTDNKQLQSRLDFVKKLFQAGDIGPLNPHQGLNFVGWTDGNPAPINIANTVIQAKVQQVLVESLPVSLETKQGDGHVWVPAGFLQPENAVNERGLSALTNRVDRPNQICLEKGSVTVQYRLPIEQGSFKLQKLQLYLNSFTSNSGRIPTLPTTIGLYDWQRQEWIQLSGVLNSAVNNNTYGSSVTKPQIQINDINDAGRFANPQTGLVLLRFSSDTNALQIEFNLALQGMR